MKRKVMAIAIIMIMFFTNYVIAVDATIKYTREGGSNLDSIASLINDDVYLDNKFNAKSNLIKFSNVEIYQYGTTTNLTPTGDGTAISYDTNTDKYYYSVRQPNENQILYYTIRLNGTNNKYENIATILYKDAIVYNGNTYNVKLDIKEIDKEGDGEEEVLVSIGARTYAEDNLYDLSTYTGATSIACGVRMNTSKTEVYCDYYIVDDSGNEVPISGVFGVTDIDANQGFAINDFVANSNNIYIKQNSDTVKYKIVDTNTTYIYSSTIDDTANDDAYPLIDNKSKMELVFTFDNSAAFSYIVFTNDAIKRYHKITTKVTGGTITDNITEIKDGEEKTITYAPNDETKQYLKSITVDGEAVDLTTYKDSYTFTNITADHTIEVVYENKLVVTHDPKGGSPTPDDQYVLPNETATEPSDPEKAGYEFKGWKKTGETTFFDYTTPITENTNIDAEWEPIVYHINYVLNGGENDSRNPSTYTVEDTIDFQNPTREGYDFKGWYQDPEFTTAKDGISHETGDKTVYAKWEARSDTKYKVEHYKETTKGNYELTVTDELTAETDDIVTATPKDYTGFVENTTHENRIPTGTVQADGSLVLKLYYDKINYTVTFDTDGGSTNPSDQIVRYEDKATEPTKPTKDGYTFKYWYYKNEKGEEVRYNFDDPVVNNIDLIAKWEDATTSTHPQTTNTTKKDTSESTKTLPKTGASQKAVVASIIIVTLALGVFIVQYIKMRDIK